jgi:catechol 2,3-dioxygenase-like lactoylglutathione lyase family enzyme
MPDDTNTIRGINHIGLTVSDLDRALAFYGDAVGLEITERRAPCDRPWRQPGADHSAEPIAVATLRGPNAWLELGELRAVRRSKPVPVVGPGFTHVCFQSPAESALYNSLVGRGATEVSRAAPVDLGGYGVRYGYARDGDGTMFEVEQFDAPPFDAQVWIAHVALVSPDIDRLVAFYAGLLGVEPYRRVNKVAGPRIDEVTGLDSVHVRAAWFNVDNMVLELWEYLTPRTPEPTAVRSLDVTGYQRFVFEVGDLEHEVARLAESGVDMIGAPTGTDDSAGRCAYARDPDGNLFGLLELPDGSGASLDRLERITWM